MSMQQVTIAVVDDDPELREAIRRLLSTQGFHVELFASTAEFMAAAIMREAACFIIDVQVDSDSGLELGWQLCSLGVSTPIIYTSGSVTPAIQRLVQELDHVAFLRKPLSCCELVEAIQQAITTDYYH